MSSYLIEVPHGEDKNSCLKAIKVFVESGSHFLANADWGCVDGEHKAWMVVNVDSKEQALQIIPPYYRDKSRITKLLKYTVKDFYKLTRIEAMEHSLKYHSE